MNATKIKHEPVNAQPGISDPPREHLVLAALAFTGADPAGCLEAVRALQAIVRAELAGKPAAADVETGELGFAAHHDDYRLRVTLAVSTSGYARLGAGADQRPIDIHPIPADVLDATGQGRGAEIAGEGDVLLHISSDDIFVAEHVLRRVEHELADRFTLVWAQTGVQRYNTRQAEKNGKNARKESRALIGFLDGTANLTLSDPTDRALVFTDHTRTDYPPNPVSDQYQGASMPADLRPPPVGPEPAYLDGGTYVAVEVLLINTRVFDASPVAAQEQIVGRTKQTGDPVPGAPAVAHVLKANPQRPGTDDAQRRILRRGYALLRPRDAGLGRGLVFIAYGRSLTAQVEFIRRAWINNPNFPQAGTGQDALLFGGAVEPRLLVGGYYFVPPLTHPHDAASWTLPGL